MKRREFITLLGGAAAAWPLAARAQQSERVRRVGVLMSAAANDREAPARIASFSGGCNNWVGLKAATYALISAGPQVIYISIVRNMRPSWSRWHQMSCWPPQPTVAALQAETRSVPIVFAHAVDPVGAGLVASLRGQTAMLPGSSCSNSVLVRNGWSC